MLEAYDTFARAAETKALKVVITADSTLFDAKLVTVNPPLACGPEGEVVPKLIPRRAGSRHNESAGPQSGRRKNDLGLRGDGAAISPRARDAATTLEFVTQPGLDVREMTLPARRSGPFAGGDEAQCGRGVRGSDRQVAEGYAPRPIGGATPRPTRARPERRQPRAMDAQGTARSVARTPLVLSDLAAATRGATGAKRPRPTGPSDRSGRRRRVQWELAAPNRRYR